MIEEGGGGADAATPVAAKVLKAAIDSLEGKLDPNSIDYISGSTGRSVAIKASSGSRTD